MSVEVKHLNADSSFLLIFSPEGRAPRADLTSANGAFSVLIDPWLVGPSIIAAPWFAKTEHRIPSAIQHLSEIGEPDVVIVSQNKPDHCHKQTLLQLRPDGKTVIVAEPSAAKTIKSWNYFDPSRVRGVPKYDPKFKFGQSLRLHVPPISPLGFPGELNITFIPAKDYMTGLHNAFGITYQPPTHNKAFAPVATIDLPPTTRYFHMPLTPVTMPSSSPPPPMSSPAVRPVSFDQPVRDRTIVLSPRLSQIRGHRPRLPKASNTASFRLPASPIKPFIEVDPRPDTGEIVERILTLPRPSPRLRFSVPFKLDPPPSTFAQALPTPPDSPGTITVATRESTSPPPTALFPSSTVFHGRKPSSRSHQDSVSSPVPALNMSPVTPGRPKAISIIYSPHGLPLDDLRPYIENHLVRLPGALPLTVLFHSFDHAQNPWYLGGNIMTGVHGGAEIARTLMARCWISAHDEPKDDSGLSVKKLRVKRVTVDEVAESLWEGEHGQWLKEKGWTCDVRSLEVGKKMVIAPEKETSFPPV
ncbi:hypothetical protein A1O3_01536 [Capronia epimyces CBS 606.96]|uniref:Uncharacterized protein n=1 Tax=Capronia epimyces CBS 606.96 TaxID=1182542 RepID=W9YTJ2_9EURO|nr:uncharacterized protein A1O3_01536 [Capronia epimyces CBS 606.96]EXJ92980.1 hypothetical protein A1O3_01536 [Capronia epimyces CBS 606.96]